MTTFWIPFNKGIHQTHWKSDKMATFLFGFLKVWFTNGQNHSNCYDLPFHTQFQNIQYSNVNSSTYCNTKLRIWITRGPALHSENPNNLPLNNWKIWVTEFHSSVIQADFFQITVNIEVLHSCLDGILDMWSELQT